MGLVFKFIYVAFFSTLISHALRCIVLHSMNKSYPNSYDLYDIKAHLYVTSISFFALFDVLALFAILNKFDMSCLAEGAIFLIIVGCYLWYYHKLDDFFKK